MNKLDINTKDLNLLIIFESLYRNRSVSKAAIELSLSQSAVSHALNRLRDMFSDPLFSRLPRGIVPTPRANQLAPRVFSAIGQMRLVFEEDFFVPEKAKGRISIASTEYLEQALLSHLFLELHKASPQLSFQFRNAQGRLPKTDLETGEFDIAIAGFFGSLPEGFYQQKLFESDFVCVARSKHPLIKAGLRMEEYTTLEHLLISPQGDLWGLIDEKLEQQKRTRSVVAGFENYMSPGWLVAQSEMVVTVPRTLGEFYAKNLDVKLYELPFPSPKITIVQAWHERTHSNPLHRHIRSLIFEKASNLRK